MLIIVPFIVIVLVIMAIDHFYYSDAKPHVAPPKEVQQNVRESNASNQYLDKYIKK